MNKKIQQVTKRHLEIIEDNVDKFMPYEYRAECYNPMFGASFPSSITFSAFKFGKYKINKYCIVYRGEHLNIKDKQITKIYQYLVDKNYLEIIEKDLGEIKQQKTEEV